MNYFTPSLSLIWPLIPIILCTQCPFIWVIFDSVIIETKRFAGIEIDIFWTLQLGSLTHKLTFCAILSATSHQCFKWNCCFSRVGMHRSFFTSRVSPSAGTKISDLSNHSDFGGYLNLPYLYNLFTHTLVTFHTVSCGHHGFSELQKVAEIKT